MPKTLQASELDRLRSRVDKKYGSGTARNFLRGHLRPEATNADAERALIMGFPDAFAPEPRQLDAQASKKEKKFRSEFQSLWNSLDRLEGGGYAARHYRQFVTEGGASDAWFLEFMKSEYGRNMKLAARIGEEASADSNPQNDMKTENEQLQAARKLTAQYEKLRGKARAAFFRDNKAALTEAAALIHREEGEEE